MSLTRSASVRKSVLKLDLRKAKYILPNLFTLSSIFCGFYAIVLCTGNAPDITQLKRAAIMIAFALFFDIADGRIARLTKTQSEFGLQLDSLADAISFGVAPALIAYHYGLHQLGTPGVFIAFLFTACGVMRLARFNVLAQSQTGSPNHFVGLPIPLACGMLISFVIADLLPYSESKLSSEGLIYYAVMSTSLSYLMVSNIPYRSFKKIGSKRKLFTFLFLFSCTFAIIAEISKPGVAFATLFASYILFGLAEAIYRKGKSFNANQSDQIILNENSNYEIFDELDDEDNDTGQEKLA